MSNAPATTEYLESLGQYLASDCEPVGYRMDWDYPGFLSVYADALPGVHIAATPGYEATEDELASGVVDVPVQWGRVDDGGESLPVDPTFRLRITGDLDEDARAYVDLLDSIVAAVAAALAKEA